MLNLQEIKNIVLLILLVTVFYTGSTAQTCNNVTDGGTICCDEAFVGGYDPVIINNLTSPTGGSGALEYMWLHSNVRVANTPGNPYWTPISGAINADYDPTAITQSTYYIRCSKRAGCTDWDGESNIVDKVVTPNAVTGCHGYALHDQGLNDYTQCLGLDMLNGSVTPIGAPIQGMDLEGLEVDHAGIMYATSGNDNQFGMDGHLFTIDGLTGDLAIVGPTGYDDVVSLATHPITGDLWAWCDDFGLLTLNKNTGAGTMQFASSLDMDGLVWNLTGTLCYGVDDNELWIFDPAANTLTMLVNNLPGTAEGLDIRDDGMLMLGFHDQNLTDIMIYDVDNLTFVPSEAIATNYGDIEGIVFPDWCTFTISANIATIGAGCNGGNGFALCTPTAGNAPFTYLWSNGATTAGTNLPAGNHTVVVTDNAGQNVTLNVTITEPSAIVSTTVSTATSCNGGTDGTASATATGGNSPYTYLWSNGGTTASISGLTAGTYSVTVTDANGCTLNDNVVIAEPSVITGITSSSDANCNAGNDGTASVIAAGGTTPYTYLWSNGGTTASITGLAAGTYTVTITDANGCSSANNATVGEPTAISLGIQSTATTCNSNCDGGLTVTISGGASPYTYLWNTGATTQNISNLCAGTYDVTVTDANGCINNISGVVNAPNPISLTATATDISCADCGTTGPTNCNIDFNNLTHGEVVSTQFVASHGVMISVIANNNKPNASLVFDTNLSGTADPDLEVGMGNAIVIPDNLTDNNNDGFADSPNDSWAGGEVTFDFTTDRDLNSFTFIDKDGGQPGTATAYDANGNILVQVSIPNAGDMSIQTITLNVQNARKLVVYYHDSGAMTNFDFGCPPASGGACDGSVDLAVNGGSAPYTFLWSDGSTTEDLTGLAPGTYDVIVTDANGCSGTATATVGTPSPIVPDVNAYPPTCGNTCDGGANASATGGTAPYTYEWSDGSTGSSITGLCDGTYFVTIIDANGCSVTEVVVISSSSHRCGTDEPISSVYPNPVNTRGTLTFTLTQSSKYKIELYSIAGEKVGDMCNGYAYAGEENRTTFQVTDYQGGSYLYVISTEFERVQDRVIIVK
jgi:hypothetical protein